MTTSLIPQTATTRRELLVFYYKYRRRLLTAFLLPFVFFVLLSFVPTPKFVANSVLIIRLGSEYIYQPEVTPAQSYSTAAIPYMNEQIFKSELAILDSDDLHQQVIAKVGLARIFPSMADAGQLSFWDTWLHPNLTTEAKQAQLMSLAADAFRKNFDLMLQKDSAVINIAYKHKDAAVAKEVLETLLDLYAQKRQALYLQPRIAMAEKQMESAKVRTTQAEAAVEEFKRINNLYSLQDERAALVERRSVIENQMATLNGAALQDKLDYFNKQLERLGALEPQLNNLVNEARAASDEYALFQHKLAEAKAFEDLERERMSSVRVIQPPMVSPKVKSLQAIILLLGFFMSSLCLLVVAAVTEYANRTFMTPERLERNLGLKVLAVIPYRA